MDMGVQRLVNSTLVRDLTNHHGGFVDFDSPMIQSFYPRLMPGFGSSNQRLINSITCVNDNDDDNDKCGMIANDNNNDGGEDRSGGGVGGTRGCLPLSHPGVRSLVADIAMGSLTPFLKDEMLEAIMSSLGLRDANDDDNHGDDNDIDDNNDAVDGDGGGMLKISQRANNHLGTTRGSHSRSVIMIRYAFPCA